jgi:hypothetical protein
VLLSASLVWLAFQLRCGTDSRASSLQPQRIWSYAAWFNYSLRTTTPARVLLAPLSTLKQPCDPVRSCPVSSAAVTNSRSHDSFALANNRFVSGGGSIPRGFPHNVPRTRTIRGQRKIPTDFPPIGSGSKCGGAPRTQTLVTICADNWRTCVLPVSKRCRWAIVRSTRSSHGRTEYSPPMCQPSSRRPAAARTRTRRKLAGWARTQRRLACACGQEK